MARFLFAATATVLLAVVFTRLSMVLAQHLGVVDYPTDRKKHHRATPLMGGFAIALTTTIILAFFLEPAVYRSWWPIIVGGWAAWLVGFIDDWLKSRGREWRPLPKLIGQILAASLPVLAGFRVEVMTNPLGGELVLVPWLSILLTVLWIVGCMNAVNFIDGLDGLAAGVPAIGAFSMFVVAAIMDEPAVALAALVMAAANVGFLRYNFHPARVFMGDAGANYIGFFLAGISVVGYFKSTISLGMIVPICALGLPIYEGFSSTLRRLREHRPVYQAGRDHLHYRLMEKGYSQPQVAGLMYLLAFVLSVSGMIIALASR
ncbi:MAG: MraY family glycosyltransferase [Bacillota bacterium]